MLCLRGLSAATVEGTHCWPHQDGKSTARMGGQEPREAGDMVSQTSRTSEADRVVDAYRGACNAALTASYGRTAEQLIEEVSDFLIVCAEQGQASATCVLYRHIDGTRDVLVPWPTVTATLDSERSKRVTPQQLPLPGPGLHTAVETVVARLEELGFPCQLHDDGRLLVDIQHTRPTARDTPERTTMSDVALLLRDVRCTADSILDSIRKVGRELLES